MNVRELFQLIDSVAPFSAQMEGDNSGLLVGSFDQEVNTVLVALDVTEPVIDEALAEKADLIVTHHPLMFSPRRQLTDEDYEGRLIRRLVRNNLSLIAAHTNLDQAPGGINDALAEVCGLTDTVGEGYVRAGYLPEPMFASAYAGVLSTALRTTVRLLGPEDAVVTRLGLCSGSGSSEWEAAVALGCDAFLSGEIRHHHALAMADQSIPCFECGHFATELPGIFALADALQNAMDTIKWKIRIVKSVQNLCSFPAQP